MTSLARSLTVEHYEYETVDFWVAERVMALVFGSPELLDASAVAAAVAVAAAALCVEGLVNPAELLYEAAAAGLIRINYERIFDDTLGQLRYGQRWQETYSVQRCLAIRHTLTHGGDCRVRMVEYTLTHKPWNVWIY